MDALVELEKSAPASIKKLIEAYKDSDIGSLDEAWRAALKDVLDENQ